MAIANMTRDLPPLSVRAAFSPATIDLERRTVHLIWSTGARVLRGFWEKFYEELSLDPAHVRMERLNNGAPLLDAHDLSAGAAGQIGVVESARLEAGRGVAVVRFAKAEDDPAAERIFRKVVDGIVQNVSVGYRVYKFEKVEGGDAEIPTFRATDWEPYELSLVPAGADDGAGVRSIDPATPNRCLIVTAPTRAQENRNMTTPTTPPTAPPSPELAAERERVRAIMDLANRYRGQGIEEGFAQRMIDGAVPLEEVREAVLRRLANFSESLPPGPGATHRSDEPPTRSAIVPGDGVRDDFQRAAIDSLLLRAGIRVERPHAAARDVSPSVYDLARTCLSRAGKSASSIFGGEGRGLKLIERAFTTSDFPQILSGALHASLRNGYETEASSHRQWVHAVPVVDFRDQERPILGSAPDLEKVLEGGEYRSGSMTEDSTKYRVEKYGKIVSLTWEVLRNDNLNAWMRLVPAMGQAARRKEADVVYALLAENSGAGPTMQDSVVLFHATHGNLTSSAAFDATQLGAGRALLRKQKAVGGGWLSLAPRTLIVPPEKETAAEVLLANASRRMTTAKAEPEWIANLQLVVEPRLPSTAVYLAADAAQIDHVELGLLDDNLNGPVADEDEEFVVDAKSWKIRHVFGAKCLDWRGLVKMPVT